MPINLTLEGWAHYAMALTVWREAGNQGYLAQAGVAHSILNRERAQSWYGRTVPDIIGWPQQYSSMTDAGDPNLIRWPRSSDPSWLLTLQVVSDVLSGLEDPTFGATHFYSDNIPPPSWTRKGTFKVQHDNMVFYWAA